MKQINVILYSESKYFTSVFSINCSYYGKWVKIKLCRSLDFLQNMRNFKGKNVNIF